MKLFNINNIFTLAVVAQQNDTADDYGVVEYVIAADYAYTTVNGSISDMERGRNKNKNKYKSKLSF